MTQEQIIYSGFHSQISLGQIPDQYQDNGPSTFVTKLYKGHLEHGFDPNEAVTTLELIDRFAHVASSLGINTPPSYGLGLSHNSHPQRYYLIERAGHVGLNLTSRINNPDFPDREVLIDLTTTLNLFRLVWDAGFPISLDPPPLNFCRDNHGQFWYVDCMPPRQRLPDNTLFSEWPAPPESSRQFIEDRYFSPLQARVIYAQWLRATASRPHITPDDLKDIIGAVLGDTAYQLINPDDPTISQVLTKPQPTDVDLLRILASEASFHGLINSAILKQVYGLCHIDPGGILPSAEDVTAAAAIITSHL